MGYDILHSICTFDLQAPNNGEESTKEKIRKNEKKKKGKQQQDKKKKGQEHIHNSSLMWIKKFLQCLVRWTTCAFHVCFTLKWISLLEVITAKLSVSCQIMSGTPSSLRLKRN